MFGQGGRGSGSNGGGGGLNVMQRAPVTLRPTSSNDTCLPWDSCGAPNSAAVPPGAAAPMMRFRSSAAAATAATPTRTGATATKMQAKKAPPRPVMSPEQMHAFIRQQRGGRENTTSRLPPEFRNHTVEIGDRSGRRAEIPADVAKFAREFKPNGGQAKKTKPVVAPPTLAPPTLASPMKSTFGGGGSGGGASDFGVAAPSWVSSGKGSDAKGRSNVETVNAILRQYGRPMEPKKNAAVDEDAARAAAAQRAKAAAAAASVAAARQRQAPPANGETVKPAPTPMTVASDELIRQMQRQQRKQQKVQRPKPPPTAAAAPNDGESQARAETEAPTEIVSSEAADATDAQNDSATVEMSVDGDEAVAEDRWSALQQAHQNSAEDVDAPFFADEARTAIETAAHKPTVQQESGDEQFTTFSVRAEGRM